METQRQVKIKPKKKLFSPSQFTVRKRVQKTFFLDQPIQNQVGIPETKLLYGQLQAGRVL